MKETMKERLEAIKEGWKESKWFRFVLIWAVIYFIAASLLYYVVFDGPFGFYLVWNVLSAREFTVYISLWAIFMAGFILGAVMLFREIIKRH